MFPKQYTIDKPKDCGSRADLSHVSAPLPPSAAVPGTEAYQRSDPGRHQRAASTIDSKQPADRCDLSGVTSPSECISPPFAFS